MSLSTVLLGVYILFLFRKKDKDDNVDAQEKKEYDENDLLCRFVVDGNGKTLGESVALYDNMVIIKSKKIYLGVPQKHIEREGKKLSVKGLFDLGKATEFGEKWRREALCDNDGVAQGKNEKN